MGKTYRDKSRARKKHGQAATDKRERRRRMASKPKCRICGTSTRPKMLTDGICLRCLDRRNAALKQHKKEMSRGFFYLVGLDENGKRMDR